MSCHGPPELVSESDSPESWPTVFSFQGSVLLSRLFPSALSAAVRVSVFLSLCHLRLSCTRISDVLYRSSVSLSLSLLLASPRLAPHGIAVGCSQTPHGRSLDPRSRSPFCRSAASVSFLSSRHLECFCPPILPISVCSGHFSVESCFFPV